jgi:hypothetical protein
VFHDVAIIRIRLCFQGKRVVVRQSGLVALEKDEA